MSSNTCDADNAPVIRAISLSLCLGLKDGGLTHRNDKGSPSYLSQVLYAIAKHRNPFNIYRSDSSDPLDSMTNTLG